MRLRGNEYVFLDQAVLNVFKAIWSVFFVGVIGYPVPPMIRLEPDGLLDVRLEAHSEHLNRIPSAIPISNRRALVNAHDEGHPDVKGCRGQVRRRNNANADFISGSEGYLPR